jgi:hypothetical protein
MLLLACCGLALGFVVPALFVSVTAQVGRHEHAVKLLAPPRASSLSLQPPVPPAGSEPAVHQLPAIPIRPEPAPHFTPPRLSSPGVRPPVQVPAQPAPGASQPASSPAPTGSKTTPTPAGPTASNTGGEPKKK